MTPAALATALLGPNYPPDAVRAIEAAFAEVRLRDPWRPIETAPRDGTRFWGHVGDDAIAMLWHSKFEAFVSSWHRMTMAAGYTFNDEAVHDHSPRTHEPTHWMPLPTPAAVERTK